MKPTLSEYELWNQLELVDVEPETPELPLYTWITTRRPGLYESLDAAVEIATEILKFHRSGVVLKEINPTSIVICPKNGRVRIFENSILADDMGFNDPQAMDERFICNVLPYLAPEQTASMKTGCDVRSVYYSLGAIYYEMFSGNSPFAAADPLEIIHGHNALEPVCLTQKIKTLPGMISRIVLKLLAKNPEDRYQGIQALVSDLNRCRRDYERHAAIPYFSPGMGDVPEQLSFSEKLYDRDDDNQKLQSIFERVRKGGSECVFISGEPGVGKTSLVYDFGLSLKQRGAYFTSGKYDPIRQRIPYSGIKACLQGMVRQILTEPPERVKIWRKKIQQVVGPNGKIIADVIPDIIHIIGKPEDAQALLPMEACNRFKQVFTNFIKGLADKDHPIVLFLDDLQWADSASLEFLNWFFSEGIPEKFLLIGTCRTQANGELNLAHRIPESWKSSGVATTHIALAPISSRSVDKLIGDSLKKTEEKGTPLSSIIYDKTGGNPFLIKRLLQTLFAEKRLWFDYEKGAWVWDSKEVVLEDILRVPVGGVTEIIRKLPKKTRELLYIGSCMGNRFALALLCAVAGLKREDGLLLLRPALNDKVITPVKTRKKENPADFAEIVEFEFCHDRIRQTTYDMMPPQLKKKLHLTIGRNIYKETLGDQFKESIFHVVNHMSLGSGLFMDKKEKEDVAGLNLRAAIHAKKSTALDAACRYCRTALALLPETRWETSYQTTLKLYMVLAECEYLIGHIQEAEKVFNEKLVHAMGRVDKARVINLRIVLYTASGRLEEALKLGVKGLGLFHEGLPEKPGKMRVFLEYIKTRCMLVLRNVDNFTTLSKVTDLEKKEIITLYTNIGTPAYYLDPDCFAYVVIKGVRLCLKYGIPTSFPFAVISFGLITGFGFGQYQSGLRFAQAGLQLLETMKDTSYKARSFFIFGFFIASWREHATKSIYYMRLARRYGMETGDLIYSGHSINAIFMTRIMAGDNLDEIYPEYQSCFGFMKRLNDPFITGNYYDNLRMYRILKGETEKSDEQEEKKRADEIRKQGNPLALFMYLNIRLRCCYYFGEYERCLHIAEEMNTVIHVPVGTLYLVEFYFYYSLALSAHLAQIGTGGKRRYIRQLKNNREKMKKWAGLCAENFQHKYYLISAELCRIGGNNNATMELYHKAITEADKHGYRQNAAIAHECAAKFLLKNGFRISARTHIEESLGGVAEWGADALVSFLQETHSDLLEIKDKARPAAFTSMIDYTSVAHSLRAISTEMNLKALLQKILFIAMENAGARRGIYISVRETGLFIEAESEVDMEEGLHFNPMPLENRSDLLRESVYYVERTGRHVVLRDAEKEGDYLACPHVVDNQLKSVLVMPVFRQSDMTGILYLENNITVGVFTAQRVKTLGLIASQSAISIENARLYEDVSHKEERLRTLSSELFLAEECERRKIAVGLHDSIGHSLTAARMTLSIAGESKKADEMNKAIRKVSGLIDRSIQDVQSLTFDLSPPVLYDFGLMAALEWLANRTKNEHGLKVCLKGGLGSPPEERVSVMIFQIVREMIFNCVKHARASQITIFIERSGEELRVQVSDDGKGFALSQRNYDIKKRGFGLFSARERVKYMGGVFNIDTAPSKGTRITFVLPMTMNDQIDMPENGGTA